MIRATNQRHAGSRWWPGEFRQSVQLHQNLSHTNIHLVEHTHTNSHRADTVEHAGWVVGVQRRWGVCDEGGSVRVPRHRRLDGALTWTTWVWSSEGCGTLHVFKQASRLKGRWMSRDEGGGGRGEGWTEGWASSLDQSDLLLEGSLCGPGGGVSGGRLDRLVGHDTCGELLLGSLETGAGGSVRRMDLKRKRRWFTTVGTLKGQFRHKYTSSHNLLPPCWGRSFKPPCCAFTFLNMMSDKTASAVKRAAMRIIMMPTGMLVFRAVSAEIHPLQSREAFKDEDGEILEFSFYKRWTQTQTHTVLLSGILKFGFIYSSQPLFCFQNFSPALASVYSTSQIHLNTHCCFKMLFWWLFSSPGAPTRDADTLQDVDAKLTDVHEEEHEKPEGAVTPAERENKQDTNSEGVFYLCQHLRWINVFVLFTWTLRKAVCTSRRTNTVWRAGTRGWTDQSQRHDRRPHRTRPGSPLSSPAASPCELSREKREVQ